MPGSAVGGDGAQHQLILSVCVSLSLALAFRCGLNPMLMLSPRPLGPRVFVNQTTIPSNPLGPTPSETCERMHRVTYQHFGVLLAEHCIE